MIAGFNMIASVLLFMAGCGTSDLKREYVASVDGEKIYLSDFENRFNTKLNLMKKNAAYNESQVRTLKKEFLDELIDENLMLRRAKNLGLSVSDDELRKRIDEIKTDYTNENFSELFKKGEFQAWQDELRKRVLLEKLIAQEVNARVSVSDEEARAYYDRNPSAWFQQDSVRVSQIVLPDREKAEEVWRRLQNGEDFAKLAREVSSGPESVKGGDLGFFAKGVLPEHFDRVLFSLTPGTFSRIVETPYGYHIFKVVERIRKSGEFQKVQTLVKEKLRREKEEAEYERWLTTLRSNVSITLNQPVLEKAGQSR